jgi:uncharacterized protein (TIGR02271 family)
LKKGKTRMTTTQPIVVGTFDDHSQAEQAVNALLSSGFNGDQIRYSGHGVATGGILASLKSLFTGEQTGSIYNDLLDLGISENDASSYQQEFEAGRAVVAVLASGRVEEARSILASYGGYGAARSTEQAGDYAASTTGTGMPQQASDYITSTTDTGMPQTDVEGEQRFKLREEQLSAQKQPVETGEARLRKDVVSEQQMMDVPVTHEEVYVESHPGSGLPSDTPIGESEAYRVPVHDEQVTTSKQTVETGEVAMGKKQFQDTQRVSDTVRREEAHVERAGEAPIQGRDVEDTTDQTTP